MVNQKLARSRHYGFVGIVTVIFVLASCFEFTKSVYAEERGLVLHYTFDEGSGQVLRDKSGKGNDGKIYGAKRVKSGKGYALSFDGVDDYVDCENDASLDIVEAITIEAWIKWRGTGSIYQYFVAKEIDKTIIPYGFRVQKDSGRLYFVTYNAGKEGRKEYGAMSNAGQVISAGKYAHVAVTFDSGTAHIYINGVDSGGKSLGGVSSLFSNSHAVYIGSRSPGTGSFNGTIDEVKIYNRALSAQEVREHFRDGGRTVGLNTPSRITLLHRFYAKRNELEVEAGMAKGRYLPSRSAMIVQLRDEKNNVVQGVTENIPKNADTVTATFKTDKLQSGLYEISAVINNLANGKHISEKSTTEWHYPAVAEFLATTPGVKMLNNLVWELMNLEKPVSGTLNERLRFTCPEDCWIFVSAKASAQANETIRLILDPDARRPLVLADVSGIQDGCEAMRYVSKGSHVLQIEGKGRVEALSVRRIPMLRYGVFDPVNKAGKSYTTDFLRAKVLRNANTLWDCHWDPADAPLVEEWRKNGGWMLMLTGHPEPKEGDANAVEDAVRYFITNPKDRNVPIGLLHPLFDGIAVDEFMPDDSPFHYQVARQVVERLKGDPRFKDRLIAPYFGWSDYVRNGRKVFEVAMREDIKAYVNTVYKHGGWLFVERYLTEEAGREAAEQQIANRLVGGFASWRTHFPDTVHRTAVTLGIECIPNQLFNRHPSANFSVYLDMQMEALANHHVFFGLGGIDVWHSVRADHETVAWMGALYRHYAIDGRTERLSVDPYELRHLSNGDFEEGSEGWTLTPADAHSMETRKMRPYGAIQGRYGGPWGETFLWMKRSDKGPNRARQTLRNLQPGRKYLLSVVVADFGDVWGGKSVPKEIALRLTMDGADMVPDHENTYEHVYRGNASARRFQGEKKERPKEAPYLTYYRKLFRAEGPTAKLVISDWIEDAQPGGPIGQEVMLNFIELKPFIEYSSGR